MFTNEANNISETFAPRGITLGRPGPRVCLFAPLIFTSINDCNAQQGQAKIPVNIFQFTNMLQIVWSIRISPCQSSKRESIFTNVVSIANRTCPIQVSKLNFCPMLTQQACMQISICDSETRGQTQNSGTD